MNRPATLVLSLVLLAAVSACGGGDDAAAPPAPGGGGGGPVTATWTCDTTLFQPDSVDAPTVEEVAAYAGTYDGDEGSFGPNPGDPFVKSGDAVFVLNEDATVSYNDTDIEILSVCVDRTAGPAGRLLYVHAADSHIDVTDAGEAFGISMTDPTQLFQNGVRR